MSFIIACGLVLAEVVFRSLCGLVLVKKDSPFEGISDSCQVLSSTVLVVGSNSWLNT